MNYIYVYYIYINIRYIYIYYVCGIYIWYIYIYIYMSGIYLDCDDVKKFIVDYGKTSEPEYRKLIPSIESETGL